MKSKKFIALFICIISFFIMSLYAGDFNNSRNLTLNTSSTGANESQEFKNMPVLIKLDESNFNFNEIKDALIGDINFSISEGSFLPYKVQNWDKPNKVLEIWIIVPVVSGNNSSQSVTMSWSKKNKTYDKQKEKDRVELKKSREAEDAFDLNKTSSVFKPSYDLFGVWISNGNEGFSIVKGGEKDIGEKDIVDDGTN